MSLKNVTLVPLNLNYHKKDLFEKSVKFLSDIPNWELLQKIVGGIITEGKVVSVSGGKEISFGFVTKNKKAVIIKITNS